MNAITQQINQRGQNLLNVGQMRQKEQQNQRENALYQQRLGLAEQSNALDQQRFDTTQANYQQGVERAEANRKVALQSTAIAKALELGEGDPEKTQQVLSLIESQAGFKFNPTDFSGVKPSGKSVVGVDIGDGKFLDVTGPTKDVAEFMAQLDDGVNDRNAVLEFASSKGLSLKQREVKPEKPEKPTAADKKFEYEKQQAAITNYADNYVSENLEGITKDKNGTYGRYVMNDATGEERFMPLTGDERKFVSYAQKRARAIAARAKNKGISFDEAAYDYEVAMSRAEQAAKDKEELKNRASANTPQSSKKAEKPKVKDKAVNDFAKEGADNPITKYLTNELGSSWTFGKSAKEIAEEQRKKKALTK